MNPTLLTQLGDELYTALTECRSVPPLTSRGLDLSVEDAYHIQLRMIERRLAAGEKIIGKKIGVTSRAVQTMLNVNRPDFGHLLSGMVYQDGDTIPMKNLILPRAEGEIAFVLKRDLTGPGVTAADVMAATEGVMACFEIVDSRIDNWQIKIQDTVADNASCGVFVLGDKLVDPRHVDLALAGMVLEKNGDIIGTGAGAGSMGHPANAVAWLANTLGEFGIPLKAGEVILSGSLAALVPVVSGDYLRVSIGGIGGCSVRFQ